MKVFLDTNVLIDYAAQRPPFCQAANAIFQLARMKHIEICASSLSFVTMVYVLRKQVTKEDLYRCLRGITSYVFITEVGQLEIHSAIRAEWNDFEDAVQYYSSLPKKIEAIITRNKKDFKSSNIPLMTPEDFLDGLISKCF